MLRKTLYSLLIPISLLALALVVLTLARIPEDQTEVWTATHHTSTDSWKIVIKFSADKFEMVTSSSEKNGHTTWSSSYTSDAGDKVRTLSPRSTHPMILDVTTGVLVNQTQTPTGTYTLQRDTRWYRTHLRTLGRLAHNADISIAGWMRSLR